MTGWVVTYMIDAIGGAHLLYLIYSIITKLEPCLLQSTLEPLCSAEKRGRFS